MFEKAPVAVAVAAAVTEKLMRILKYLRIVFCCSDLITLKGCTTFASSEES